MQPACLDLLNSLFSRNLSETFPGAPHFLSSIFQAQEISPHLNLLLFPEHQCLNTEHQCGALQPIISILPIAHRNKETNGPKTQGLPPRPCHVTSYLSCTAIKLQAAQVSFAIHVEPQVTQQQLPEVICIVLYILQPLLFPVKVSDFLTISCFPLSACRVQPNDALVIF